MKSGKWQMTEGMVLPNQKKKKWTLGEKETYKYLGILEADFINKWRFKKKIKKNVSGKQEIYLKSNYLAGTL